MSQLTIPSLSLFNRSPPKKQHYTHHITKTQNSLVDTLRQSRNLHKTPYLPSNVQHYFNQQYRMLKCHQQLQYLDAYRNALNRQAAAPVVGSVATPALGSYHSSLRQSSLHSFGKTRKPCICQSPRHPHLHQNYTKHQNLNHTNYLNSHPPKQKPVPQPDNSSKMLIKDPYLGQKQQESNNNKHQTNLGIFSDIAKFIKQDTKQNVNKSVMINDSLKPPRNQAQVQTQQPAVDRSSFLITSAIQKIPQFMDKQNFKKSIKHLNEHINSLKIDLQTQDIIIDLNDLILTKDQYIEQSRSLLSKLVSLSNGKVAEVNKNQNQKGGIVWPEGI